MGGSVNNYGIPRTYLNKFIDRILEVGLTWLDFYPYSAK